MTIDQCITDIKFQFNVIGIIDCAKYNPSSVDLYNKIQSLHKEVYENSDRLIFLISKDFYKKNSSAGIMLQSLQIMINDIDISNFFVSVVTTNPKIKTEYQWVVDNISTDKIPVTIYECDEEYLRLDGANQLGYSKYQKIENNSIIDPLSDKNKQLLFENASFCMAPWTSIMIDQNSKVRPCCMFTGGDIGDCSVSSLEQIWNSDTVKQIRKDMLAGKKVNACSVCYNNEDLERDSLRKNLNRRFIHHSNKIDSTRKDGFNEYNLNYLDARFNNLCNLSCRSCGPNASSSWYQPALAIGKINKSVKALKIAGKDNHDIFDQIIQQLDNIECIYFAGGEPLMMEQFYQIVEELDRRGRHDVELVYNVNMTKWSLGERSVFDIWKNFKKISIGASLDGEFQRGEYLRCGQRWDDVVRFRKEILVNRPDIDFYISSTTSILNALHLPDFHRSWVDQGLIAPKDFNINLLFWPTYLSVDCAPKYLKDAIRKKYQEHIKWLQPLDPIGRATYGFKSVINYLDNDKEFDPVDFWSNITPLDNYYELNLLEVFPELSNLPVN